jgi:hypothetical protein
VYVSIVSKVAIGIHILDAIAHGTGCNYFIFITLSMIAIGLMC